MFLNVFIAGINAKIKKVAFVGKLKNVSILLKVVGIGFGDCIQHNIKAGFI